MDASSAFGAAAGPLPDEQAAQAAMNQALSRALAGIRQEYREALAMAVGFTGVAYQVGAWLMSRFVGTERSAYGVVALGVLAITGVTLAARLGALVGGFLVGGPLGAVGYLIEYAAWTIGLGASILAWYSTRQPRVAAQTASPTPSTS